MYTHYSRSALITFVKASWTIEMSHGQAETYLLDWMENIVTDFVGF
jgi:hypothetical protein